MRQRVSSGEHFRRGNAHDSYPRTIRTELDDGAKHRTNQYLNNRIEQDHRGIKGRYGPMRGFKSHESAARFCRSFNELPNSLTACILDHAVAETFQSPPPAIVSLPMASSRSASRSGLIWKSGASLKPTQRRDH